MTWRGSATTSDRIFASLPYLLPLIDGIVFGRYLFNQFPAVGVVFSPLLPLVVIYNSIPFIGLIVFFALFLLVIRNENISHFIRFNTMQAILLDIVIFLFSLVLQILMPIPSAGFAIETLTNTLFLGIVAAVVYAVVQSLLGRYAEIPAISDAVRMQVP
jgi:uncharacterized membrane protein